MKHTIKYITFIAALMLYVTLLPFYAVSAEMTDDFNAEEQFSSMYGEDYWKNLEQFRTNNAKLTSFFLKDSTGEPIYPDFIGGIYHTDEGNMILQIVEKYATKDAALYKHVREYTAQADCIVIENVIFSYNELKATMDTLNALYLADKRPEAFVNVDSFAEDTINNAVKVQLSVFNETEIALFKSEILDSPSIAFVESDGKFVTLFNEGENQPASIQPQRDNTPSTLLIALSVGLLGVLSIFFLLRQAHFIPALQTAHGSVFTANAPVSNKQTIASIKRSVSLPRSDLFASIVDKIDGVDTETNKRND